LFDRDESSHDLCIKFVTIYYLYIHTIFVDVKSGTLYPVKQDVSAPVQTSSHTYLDVNSTTDTHTPFKGIANKKDFKNPKHS
jgi:hypothetical protein